MHYFYPYNSTLGIFTVFLPAKSEARLNLAVTVLLGFMFIQTIVAGLMPRSNDWPLISKYIISSLVLSVFNLAACSVCVGIGSLSENSNPPLFLRWASYNFWNLLKSCRRRSVNSENHNNKPRTAHFEENEFEVMMFQNSNIQDNHGK